MSDTKAPASWFRRSLIWLVRIGVATMVLSGIAPALGLILLLTFPLVPFIALPFVLSFTNLMSASAPEPTSTPKPKAKPARAPQLDSEPRFST